MLRLGRRVNIWIRQNETDKRTSLHVLWLCLDICMDEEVCLLHRTMEGSIVLLPTVTWQRRLTFAIMSQRDSGWSLFATTWHFLKLGSLLRRGRWNVLSWNVGWWHRRRSRGGGDRGIGPPLLGLGIIPHFLWCAGNVQLHGWKFLCSNIGKNYQNLQNCIIFSAKFIFFSGGKPPDPQLGRAQHLPRPHLSLFSIFIPHF